MSDERPKLVKSYRDLIVYQKAFSSSMEIFNLSRKWPAAEKYSLTDQINRASKSICTNIAESWRKRRYPAHFVSKLSDATAETSETEVWLDFALECKYITRIDHSKLRDNYDQIGKMLTTMMNKPEKWCNENSGK